MDVDGLWIIFQCNLVWIISSVGPRIRDMTQILSCPVLSLSGQPRTSCLLSLTKTGRSAGSFADGVYIINYKNLDPYSHLQISPGLWMWKQSDIAGLQNLTGLCEPYPQGLLYIRARLHRPEVEWGYTLSQGCSGLQEKTLESSFTEKLLSSGTTSPCLRLWPNTSYAWAGMRTCWNYIASITVQYNYPKECMLYNYISQHYGRKHTLYQILKMFSMIYLEHYVLMLSKTPLCLVQTKCQFFLNFTTIFFYYIKWTWSL